MFDCKAEVCDFIKKKYKNVFKHVSLNTSQLNRLKSIGWASVAV